MRFLSLLLALHLFLTHGRTRVPLLMSNTPLGLCGKYAFWRSQRETMSESCDSCGSDDEKYAMAEVELFQRASDNSFHVCIYVGSNI